MKANIVQKFEKIYEEDSDVIFRFCLIRVSNREQALDITQETFLRLWKSLKSDKEILNNRAFLFTIAHRLVIDWYRKKKSVSLDSLDSLKTYQNMDKERKEENSSYDLVDEASESIELKAEGRFVLEKMYELSPSYRDPIYWRFVEGLSPVEIGEILGISANAASVRINRGMMELRNKTGYNNDES